MNEGSICQDGTPEELAALIEASKNGQMAPAMTEKEETGDEEN